MRRYYILILITISMLNVSGLFYNFVINKSSVFQEENIHGLRNSRLYLTNNIPLVPTIQLENGFNSINPTIIDLEPHLAVQQINVTSILDISGDKSPYSLVFEENIWDAILGSDPVLVDNPSLYQNGLIVTNSTVFPIDESITTNELASVNNSLFVRIGNNGYGSTYREPENQNDPDEDISGGISAGWQINFSVEDDFEVIQVSFKWRFDAQDWAFDIYNESLPWFMNPDTSDDYQEVRCRIKHPYSDQSSFWMGNSKNQTNPNGTVFYRVGPIVEKDEEWYFFNYSFHLPPTEDVILELGTYLNTRERYDEYFDVWFDDILIQGVNNITDKLAPHPINFDLSKTEDVSRWEFWVNLSEGTWETPIKNVTVVFYNQSLILTNRSLSLNNTILNEAGYNQTHWQYSEHFTFGENISFKFLIYDEAENYKETEEKKQRIGDFDPPKITTSPLTINNLNFVRQLGNGTILIRVGTSDWGNATDDVILNYTLNFRNGTRYNNAVYMSKNGSDYQYKLFVSYRTLLEFRIILTDTASNLREYPEDHRWFNVVSEIDNIPPLVNFTINASKSEEGRTFVYVDAEDPFGNIDNQSVFLVILHEDGTLENISLVKGVAGTYGLGTSLNLKYAKKYNMTVFARDEGGLVNSSSQFYVVPDKIAPKISSIDPEYLYPGKLRIWVQASDLGSDIDYVTFEKRENNEWAAAIKLIRVNSNNFYLEVNTGWFGNEKIIYRINAIDNEGNLIENLPIKSHTTPFFFTTVPGLLLSELIVVLVAVSMFASIRIIQLRQLRVRRRRRFDIALGRSERLAYLGEEAMFGFVAAYSQGEDVSSILLWEPRLIGHFYQYLKELVDKANTNISFIMKAKAMDLVTFVDFKIEQIGCSAITYAYPVSTLPQRWLSSVTLDQVPIGGGQGVLLLMLLMREKWGEIANNFQDEISDGMLELKDLILSGEDKENLLRKSQEFRLFISGTLEVLDEIETETDEVSDDIMGDFETEFLDEIHDDEESRDEDLSD
ncbi:MAG: hypothetical protein ACFFB2_12765 [Promethearchaeota archaeon]